MKYITNAFSLNMLPGSLMTGVVGFKRVDSAEASAFAADAKSVIGHADTAKVVGNALGIEVQPNRETVTLYPGDEVLVAQYIGPRLKEGAINLPEGARIDFFILSVH